MNADSGQAKRLLDALEGAVPAQTARDHAEVLKAEGMGQLEMYRLYDEYKRDEWERFLHTVTEWDVKTYLDCLP